MEVKAEHIKPYDTDRAKTEQVREMFDSIAPAYDWMNRAMTFGVDKSWRRKAVSMVAASKPGHIVDIATGTGDLAIALANKMPYASVTGIDLSQGMVDIGRTKVTAAGLDSRIDLLTADCLDMPFEDSSTDVITVAYGVRNFEHLDRGYAEMVRVLKPGGLLCVVELSTPVNPIIKPFYKLYTKFIIPTVGRMVSKDSRAYSYLPESIAAVPQGDDMLRLMRDAGFTDTKFKRLTFGVCTIYTGHKPR